MPQSEIDRAVCRATGETRRTIRSYGFSKLNEEPISADHPLLILDCPGCGASLDATNASTGALRFIGCPRCDAVYPFGIQEIYVADGPTAVLAACA